MRAAAARGEAGVWSALAYGAGMPPAEAAVTRRLARRAGGEPQEGGGGVAVADSRRGWSEAGSLSMGGSGRPAGA